jgi:alpha-L-fucosidase 2
MVFNASRFALLVLFISAFAAVCMGKSYEDVEFGQAGGQSLRMDAYVPEGGGPFPAVIIVHGGAWVTGDRKRSVQPLFAPLSNAGFAWFSISYRLASTGDADSISSGIASAALLGAAVDDVRDAVGYVKRRAADYRVDPNRIALIGESAGGQLASMAALKPTTEGPVAAVVAFYSPSNLANLVQTMKQIPDSIRQAVKGTPFEDLLMATLRGLSPINWVRRDSPPFLLIHGTQDGVVPFEQSVDMCNAMRKAGAACDLYPVDGGGHGVRWWESIPGQTAYKQYFTRWLAENI